MKHILTLVLVATLSLLLQAPSFGQNPNTEEADQKLEKAVLKGKKASKAKSTDQKSRKAEAKGRIDKSAQKIEKAVDKAKRQTEKASDELTQGSEVRDRSKKAYEKANKVNKDKSANGREMSEDRVKDKVGKPHSHEAGDDHEHGNDSGTHGESMEKAAKGRDKAAKNKVNKGAKADRLEDNDGASKDTKGKSNAYGREKGELSGKEFGAARAADAKQAKVVRKAELEKTITKNNSKATEAREKVKLAKDKLESDKKAGRLNDADYATKKAKIEAVEKGIENLEKVVKNATTIKQKLD